MSDENPNPLTPPAPPSDEGAPKQPGLAARLEQVIGERNAIRAELATAKEAAAQSATLAQELADTKAARSAEQASWGEERELLRTGLVDDEAQSVARLLYQRLPEADRPKSIGEWVGSMRAEGAKPPPALAPYLGAVGAPPPAPPPPKAQGSGWPSPAAPAVSAAAVVAARKRWQDAGSPAAGPLAEAMRALTAAGKNSRA